MVGPENVNRVLVKNGFPDKHRCIHFMDSLAFNPDYKGLYGNFIWAFKENYDIFSVVDEFDFQKWKKVIYF